MPLAASLSFRGVMHTVCGVCVIPIKTKERTCLYAAMWMYNSEGVTYIKKKEKKKKQSLFNCDDTVK